MKKLLILALLALLVPASAMAMKGMEHKKEGMKMGQEGMKMGQEGMKKGMKMDHGGMGMDGVILLQDDVVDGVKAAAHLMDGKKGKMLMLMFTDVESGSMISKGRVAVKVEDPNEKIGEAQKMKKSKGMFGAPVKLDKKGEYHFKVGTKLADGEKRSFHFHYENK
ncbi:MAG: hypothetical protein L3J63_06045 [Geopsychrobacter sp.]|nr:hypothetical protein [Geopsychrobacter sp.]